MNLAIPALPSEAATVVVADDDDEARSVLATSLRAVGFHVVELADGRALHEHLLGTADAGAAPRVVIAEMFMPGMTGLEVCANAKDSGLPAYFILTSSLGSDELLAEARRAGAHAVFAKPFDAAKLRDMVRQVVLDAGD